MASLRQAGFPETVIRAVAKGLIDERYEQRERKLLDPDQPVSPFWEARSSIYQIDPETQAQLRELNREKQQELVALLGEVPTDYRTLFYMRQRFGDLPPGKLTELMQINSDYSDLTAQIRQRNIGLPPMPWEQEQLAYIEQEQRADIEAMLTPEELEMHDLYSSTSAQSLRRQLGNFSPTEEEFRALYQLQQIFDETFDLTRGPRDPATLRARRTAEEQLNEQFKTVLGEERYSDFQRNRDRGFRAASSVAEHFKLPGENAVAVYELAKEMETRGRSVIANRELPPEQRDVQLSELAVDAAKQLNELLTPAGATAYRDSGAGLSWLSMLEPRPPARPAPSP